MVSKYIDHQGKVTCWILNSSSPKSEEMGCVWIRGLWVKIWELRLEAMEASTTEGHVQRISDDLGLNFYKIALRAAINNWIFPICILKIAVIVNCQVKASFFALNYWCHFMDSSSKALEEVIFYFISFLRSVSLTFNLTTFWTAADGVGGKYYTFGKKHHVYKYPCLFSSDQWRALRTG